MRGMAQCSIDAYGLRCYPLMQGVSCRQCEQFYAAIRSWDTPGGDGGGEGRPGIIPSCGHAHQQQAAAGGRPVGGSGAGRSGGGVEGGGQGDAGRAQVLRQEASRHRYRRGNVRPDTQPGFWDMGFAGDTDDEDELRGRCVVSSGRISGAACGCRSCPCINPQGGERGPSGVVLS